MSPAGRANTSVQGNFRWDERPAMPTWFQVAPQKETP